MSKLMPKVVALGLFPAALHATPIPLAPGIQQSITDKELWTQQMVLAHVKETINDPGPKSDIPTRDNSAKVNNLGFQSHKVEKLEDFSGELDLTGIEKPVRISILVDDKATLRVTSAGGFSANYAVNGSALWRPQSFDMFSTILPGKTKYQLKLTYENTANLTDRPEYAGKVDVDGVNIYVSSVETAQWRVKAKQYTVRFDKDSETQIPGVKILENATLAATFTWSEKSAMLEGKNWIEKVKDPALVYATVPVKIEWKGITEILHVAFEGHGSDDFMRVDEVKVDVAAYAEAAQMDPLPNQTVVNGATVHWGWRGDDPFVTSISHEGKEIELSHSSAARGQVISVSLPDGGEGAVLDEEGNRIYPGNFNAPHMDVDFSHKVTAN